jgi:hypothetical protein
MIDHASAFEDLAPPLDAAERLARNLRQRFVGEELQRRAQAVREQLAKLDKAKEIRPETMRIEVNI